MSHHIQLKIESPSREYFRGRDSFRFRATVVSAVNMPFEIFVAERQLVDPENPDSELKIDFKSICSAIDLSSYPANSPAPGQSPPFFRVSVMDILLPSLAEYEKTKQAVQEQVKSLCDQCDHLDNMEEDETVWIPFTPSDLPTPTTTPPP